MFSFLSQRILSIWMNLTPFMKSFPTKISRFPPKIITISPGGYRGYYLLGVTNYLKDHFDTDSYIFSGASAGAWFSLMMTYRGNHSELLENLNVFSPEFIQQDLRQIQHSVSKTLLSKYTTVDFDLKRLAIGVSRIRPFYVESTIYTDFRDLKDAVECCQASSHIPFITGGMYRIYDRRLAFDGGSVCIRIWFRRHRRPDGEEGQWKNRCYILARIYGKRTWKKIRNGIAVPHF